jgi:hypothetical protein
VVDVTDVGVCVPRRATRALPIDSANAARIKRPKRRCFGGGGGGHEKRASD